MARGQRVGARAFHSESPEPVGSSGPDFSAGRGSRYVDSKDSQSSLAFHRIRATMADAHSMARVASELFSDDRLRHYVRRAPATNFH